MNIQIHSVHFSLDKSLKDFINKRLDKLISIDEKIIKTDVYLKMDRRESYNNKIIEIKIHSNLGEYFAKKQSDSFEESIDLVCQALRKQILKNKEK